MTITLPPDTYVHMRQYYVELRGKSSTKDELYDLTIIPLAGVIMDLCSMVLLDMPETAPRMRALSGTALTLPRNIWASGEYVNAPEMGVYKGDRLSAGTYGFAYLLATLGDQLEIIADNPAEVTDGVRHFLQRSVVISAAAAMRLHVIRIHSGIERAASFTGPTAHPSSPLLGRTHDDHNWVVNCGQCSNLAAFKWWELGKAHRKATLHQLAASHPEVMSIVGD